MFAAGRVAANQSAASTPAGSVRSRAACVEGDAPLRSHGGCLAVRRRCVPKGPATPPATVHLYGGADTTAARGRAVVRIQPSAAARLKCVHHDPANLLRRVESRRTRTLDSCRRGSQERSHRDPWHQVLQVQAPTSCPRRERRLEELSRGTQEDRWVDRANEWLTLERAAWRCLLLWGNP